MLRYRHRYRLAPNDPLVLSLTPLAIQLDNELHDILEAASKEGGAPSEAQQCDQCGGWSYDSTRCPSCPGRPAYTLAQRLLDREEAGDAVDWQREFFDVMDADLPRKADG